jgi:hypothetical protein
LGFGPPKQEGDAGLRAAGRSDRQAGAFSKARQVCEMCAKVGEFELSTAHAAGDQQRC